MKSGRRLELEVRDVLDASHPACALSGVCLFRPDQFNKERDLGFEIDHLLHFHVDGADHLLLIECKAQVVKFRGAAPNKAVQEWVVEYARPGQEPKVKFLKTQLFDQAQALLQNIFPREQTENLHLHAIVVSDDVGTESLTQKSPSQNRLTYHLRSFAILEKLLKSPPDLAVLLGAKSDRLRPLRVQQSDILRKVRHSLIVPELGHPEVPNGIRYVGRCRETLDCELTKLFQPTREGRWAINGAAGMGKTVLLAYAATVFASGKVIQEIVADRQISRRTLVPWDNSAIEASLPPLGRRKIVLFGLNPKQCDVLTKECARFRAEFQHLADAADDSSLAHFPLPPRVESWRDGVEIRADVLLIDEAHDLTPQAQAAIRDWWAKGEGKRYLILACDRHQKLRLVGDQTSILQGLSFSGCSTRLTRNYRCPSPVYGAALALMFRWFGAGGVKVMPTQTDLVGSFGFGIDPAAPFPAEPGRPVQLHIRNDCHPANYWSFTVARYGDWHIAYRWIDDWGLQSEQVLWVRFSHTDPYLDQERLSRVQLRDLQVHDPDRVIDTHIKGREFPVVVIEGLPPEGVNQDDIPAMLLWRRRLYLCASRATCFLFFVYPGPDGSAASSSWDTELRALLASCSEPINRQEASSKFWRMDFGFPDQLLRPDIFTELESQVSSPPEPLAPGSTSQPLAPPPAILPTPPVPPILQKVAPPPVVLSPVLPPPPQVSTTIPPAAPPKSAVASPELISEKDFQRRYGQEKGWRRTYAQYLQTGILPAHRPVLKNPPIQRPAPISPTAATHGAILTRPINHALAPVQVTPPPTISSVAKPPVMTPRMISEHLGLKPFKVLKTAMDAMRSRKMTTMPELDKDLSAEIVADVYQTQSAQLPELQDLRALRQLVSEFKATSPR
ncbi:MAG: hypothetical protein NTU80_10960 [Verrucomicrobia bacterium]|nr:hypothetical protein [Verrucomicrobiota bacterium]